MQYTRKGRTSPVRPPLETDFIDAESIPHTFSEILAIKENDGMFWR